MTRAPAGRPRLPAWALPAGLALAHLALAVAFGVGQPLFEAHDEPGYYFYVRHLQAYGTLPVQTEKFDAPRAHHPPGYFWLGAWLTRGVRVPGPPDALQLQVNPHFGFRPDDPTHDNKAYYLHNGPDERFPYAGQARAAHLLRLLSAAFSTVAVVFTYGAARRLRPENQPFALLAAGLLAFNPMVLIMSGLISNDTSVLAASAAMMYALGRQPARPLAWATVGGLLGVGLLLKTSVLVLLAPIALGLLAAAWRARRPAALLVNGLAVLAPAALLAGWWFARNVALYGDWTGNAAVALVNGRVPPAERWANLPGNLAWLLQGAFGCAPLGPLSLCYPWPVYAAAALAFGTAAAGLAAWLWRAATRGRLPGWLRGAPASQRWLWLAHALLAAGTAASVLAYALTYRNAWTGRLLFPAYPSLAVLLAAGALAWVGRRARPWLATLAPAALVGVAAYGLWGLVLPRYGSPRAPWPGEVARSAPLDAQIGEAARVLAYRVQPAHPRPGDVLAVTIYWQVLAPTDEPYTVFVHLFAPGIGTLAQRDTYPGLGNYATTFWQPGRVFVDKYRLYLPADAPAVSDAQILLGLYDAATGARLPVTGADAGPPEMAWVEIEGIEMGQQ